MEIFRVEHPAHDHGPYIVPYGDDACALLAEDLVEYHSDARDHPSPAMIRYQQSCGFDSMGALLEWFAGFEAELDECGYVIAVYSANLAVGDGPDGFGQVVFHKRGLTPIRTESLV